MLGMLAGRLLNACLEVICNPSDDVLCIEGKVDLGLVPYLNGDQKLGHVQINNMQKHMGTVPQLSRNLPLPNNDDNHNNV